MEVITTNISSLFYSVRGIHNFILATSDLILLQWQNLYQCDKILYNDELMTMSVIINYTNWAWSLGYHGLMKRQFGRMPPLPL